MQLRKFRARRGFRTHHLAAFPVAYIEPMWRELIAKFYPDHEFRPGASEEQLTVAEARLGVALPAVIRDLLRDTNGAFGEYSLGLVWPLERIVKDNLEFRSFPDFRDLYMPFDPLLFFGDAGNGDQFAFVILDGVVQRPDVFVWNHEDDSRTWVAPDLERYFEWWADGRIKT